MSGKFAQAMFCTYEKAKWTWMGDIYATQVYQKGMAHMIRYSQYPNSAKWLWYHSHFRLVMWYIARVSDTASDCELDVVVIKIDTSDSKTSVHVYTMF